MGASQPKNIEITLNVNYDPNTIKGSVGNDLDYTAPPPISSLQAKAIAKGEDGKDIPVKLSIKSNSKNNNEKISTLASENGENNLTSNYNIDNNIARNKDDKNQFSIFDEENTGELNKDKNNDKNIDKNIDTFKKNNNINNSDDNNIINEKKNENIINDNNNMKNKSEENNFLKEGVRGKTKFGDEEEEGKIDDPATPVGENIDMNIPKNKLLINNSTPINDNDENGNINMNEGSSFKKNERKEKDKYLGLNFSNGDLSISQTIYSDNYASLENSSHLIQKGFIPLFMKLNDNSPLLLHIREENTLVSLVYSYFQYSGKTDEGILNDIKLYNNKMPLDINTPVKYLKLAPFSIISNNKEYSITNKG